MSLEQEEFKFSFHSECNGFLNVESVLVIDEKCVHRIFISHFAIRIRSHISL